MRCSANSFFVATEIIGQYCGNLEHDFLELIAAEGQKNMWGGCIVSVKIRVYNLRNLFTSAVKTINKKSFVKIVPARFQTMHFINDLGLLFGEREEINSNFRSANFLFIEKRICYIDLRPQPAKCYLMKYFET